MNITTKMLIEDNCAYKSIAVYHMLKELMDEEQTVVLNTTELKALLKCTTSSQEYFRTMDELTSRGLIDMERAGWSTVFYIHTSI